VVFEDADGLGNSAVKDPKVGLVEIADGVALRVLHSGNETHEFRLLAEDGLLREGSGGERES
jgi:hypothetical protein